MKCVAHLIGLDHECREPEGCTDEDGPSEPEFSNHLLGAGDSAGSESDSEDEEVERRTYKDPSSYRDQQSTGRKQAAKWFPLDREALCEWAMKKDCGGGKFPITGCAANLQQARHHGPDKSTLNNDNGNVHRICHSCHNRWHTLNDPDYIREEWAMCPHKPKPADLEDLVENEKFWEGRKIVKAKD